jgi:hypothetical protein
MALSDPGLVWLSVRVLFPRDQLAAVLAAVEALPAGTAEREAA